MLAIVVALTVCFLTLVRRKLFVYFVFCFFLRYCFFLLLIMKICVSCELLLSSVKESCVCYRRGIVINRLIIIIFSPRYI